MTQHRICRGLAFYSLVILSGILPLGCSGSGVVYPETGATLEGKITYGNEPVPFGLVIAVGDTSATGKIERDGSYTIANCPVGEVKIAVNTEAGRGDYMTLVMSSSQPGPDGKVANTTKIKFVDVPKKYHDPETSTLRTTVNKGKNSYDINISK
jgi:hypothetical protein